MNATGGLLKRIPLNVYGWPNQPPATTHKPNLPLSSSDFGKLFDNLGTSTDHEIEVFDTDSSLAQAFTTGTYISTGSNPEGYTLTALQVRVASTQGFVGGLRAAIHADDNGQPATAALRVLSLQAYPRPGIATFYIPSIPLRLAADTTYWLVVDAPTSATRQRKIGLGLTGDGNDECVTGDWSFAGVVHEYDGATLMNPRKVTSRWRSWASRDSPARPGPSSRPAAG